MKVKCVDGKLRHFTVAQDVSNQPHRSPFSATVTEAFCNACGEKFGAHVTWLLKPKFKEHICKEKDNDNQGGHS